MKNFLAPAIIIIFTAIASYISQLAEAQLVGNPLSSITAIEAHKMVQQDRAILVDVRERNEVEKGLAMQAQWMPLSEMENDNLRYIDFLNHLPKNKTIILYCASGKRAKKAQRKLEDRGYQTENIGGFVDWTAAQLPTRPFNSK